MIWVGYCIITPRLHDTYFSLIFIIYFFIYTLFSSFLKFVISTKIKTVLNWQKQIL